MPGNVSNNNNKKYATFSCCCLNSNVCIEIFFSKSFFLHPVHDFFCETLHSGKLNNAFRVTSSSFNYSRTHLVIDAVQCGAVLGIGMRCRDGCGECGSHSSTTTGRGAL